MLEQEKILTLHPDGKQGVNISLAKYEVIKNFILNLLKERGEITYQELNKLAIETLSPTFNGKVGWYVVCVKLDLEARALIERVPKSSPHKIRTIS